MTPTERFVWAVFAHLIADWVLQNDWMARNKHQFGSAASIVHAIIHGFAQIPVFSTDVPVVGFPGALAVLHAIIDTRAPVRWWQRVFRQTREGPVAPVVAMAVDQVFHLIVLAVAVWLVEVFR